MSTASSTVGSKSVVGTLPVWPPPSPPWIITASAPHDATFLACLGAPMLGTTTMSCSLSMAISSGFGASAKLATLTPWSMSSRHRSTASPASARRLTPNGCGVRSLTSTTAFSSSSIDMVADARIPSPPAFAVPETRRGPETQPMPVCTTGCRTPTRSVNGVRSSCSINVRHLLEAQALRVEHLADQDQLLRRRRAGGRHVGRHVQLEPGRRAHLVDGDAGVHAEQTERVAGALHVEHRQVADHPVDVVEARARRSGLLREPRAHAGDDVDALDEDAGRVPGHPVRRAVVDRV